MNRLMVLPTRQVLEKYRASFELAREQNIPMHAIGHFVTWSLVGSDWVDNRPRAFEEFNHDFCAYLHECGFVLPDVPDDRYDTMVDESNELTRAVYALYLHVLSNRILLLAENDSEYRLAGLTFFDWQGLDMVINASYFARGTWTYRSASPAPGSNISTVHAALKSLVETHAKSIEGLPR